MTRRLDIGPLTLILGALVLLVALFLDWFGGWNAWRLFELTDVVLAGLAVAAIAAALPLLVPDVNLVERRLIPWIVAAAFVVVAVELVAPQAALEGAERGVGGWLALAATVVMGLGALLSLGRVSFAVSVEGRDRRRRVSAVDHRPPPTEQNTPVAPSSSSLLKPDESPEAEQG